MFPLESDLFFRYVRACGLALLALCCGVAHAAELGEVTVRSYLAQPLVADIELVSLADPAQPVQVRLASPDVYKGANIAMPAILSTLNMSTMRREGRQFLHITSTRNIDADYLLLFLDLGEGARRSVRQVTVWLQADPHPAPPPPPPTPVAAPLAPAIAPAAAVAAAVAAPGAAAAPAPAAAAAPHHASSLPAPAPVRPPAALAYTPGAQKASAEQVKACAAIDYKNGLLSAQIVELEEKVRALQLAIEGKGELVAPAPAARPMTPVILPQSAFKSARADKKKAGLPWMWIGVGGAALLAVVGGVMFFLKRKKAKGKAPAVPSPSRFAGLAARFKRKPKAPKAALPAAEAEPETA